MTFLSRVILALLLLAGGATAGPRFPELQPLQGAWVPEGARCENVFFRQGTSVNFRKPGAVVREGILIEDNRLGDSRQRCVITKFRKDGERFRMLVTCSKFETILTSKFSLVLAFADENTVVRSFSDFPDETLRLRRCRI